MTEKHGKDGKGRFTKGNTFGQGNPFAKKTAQLRTGLINSVTKKDVSAIINRLKEDAIAGNTTAAKILLDRLFGPLINVDVLERLEELEKHLEGEE